MLSKRVLVTFNEEELRLIESVKHEGVPLATWSRLTLMKSVQRTLKWRAEHGRSVPGVVRSVGVQPKHEGEWSDRSSEQPYPEGY